VALYSLPVSFLVDVVLSLTMRMIRAFLLDDGSTVPKKIRNAQLQQYSYIVVVGKEELQGGTVSVRKREGAATVQMMDVAAFVGHVVGEMQRRE
jgi:threonyl-tRNA synthetase